MSPKDLKNAVTLHDLLTASREKSNMSDSYVSTVVRYLSLRIPDFCSHTARKSGDLSLRSYDPTKTVQCDPGIRMILQEFKSS